MSMISVSGLTFGYDGSSELIFDRVSFLLDTDWKLGFVGRNGRGKTTFLNLLLGKYEYSGTISADVSFTYFPCRPGDEQADTMNAVREICPDCEDWEILCELSQLDVSEDVLNRPFCTLSQGEQTKVMLAAMFLQPHGFPLIDEPTNHLDAPTRRIVAEYLSGKSGFILVSHDRALLDRCVDHILSINRADITVQKGNFSGWQRMKRQQDEQELARSRRLKKEISRLESAAGRTAGWSEQVEQSKRGSRNSGLRPDRGYIGHKAAKMMKRAKAIEQRRHQAAEEKSGLLKNIEKADGLRLAPLEFHTARLVELEDVAIHYGERTVCEGVRFAVEQGDRIALSGANGCGKSSILKLICGEDIAYTGTLRKNRQLKISYVPQSTEHLRGSLQEYARQREIDTGKFLTILRKLDLPRGQFDKTMEGFSAGQKKKVLLAASLCEQAHLYVWDEPLNYIDVLSRVQIEELLLEYRPTLLFVEHDEAFCRAAATRTVRL